MKAEKTLDLMIKGHKWPFWYVLISEMSTTETSLQGVNRSQV